ncbi:ABC transporter permease [Mesorhizobium sp. BH1-1-5]|uniref:ABC transporter permease n=1 Tax=Mesorhizobium sp. BH1-1-5 TaxID=2876661 RepID=UPI001CCDC069|nr:ABC transporter permease [Mesorhizobium sp. BH1-1-5]MBZ9990789.1 ABC transporter permease [Mesorhizobium sp. BH1-1-5]
MSAIARLRNPKASYALMLLPVLALIGFLFIYPMVDMVARSLGSTQGTLTTQYYAPIFSKTIYLRVLWNTFEISLLTTLVTLVLAYPVAYLIATGRRPLSLFLTVCTLIPFFTSLLVRTYGWMVILSPEGLLNEALGLLGLGPVALLYTRGAVLVGMTYSLLPYMVLTLASVFRGIDPGLMRAAGLFGASNVRAFLHVYFPLSLPGVLGGSLLVFLLAIGYFITPALLGSGRDQMIAMIVYEQVDRSLNWEFAAALSTLLFATTLAVFFVYARVFGLGKALEAKR